MMMNEPKALKEIHEIRERIFLETKNLTPEEYNARVRQRSQNLLERYGIQLETVKCPESKPLHGVV